MKFELHLSNNTIYINKITCKRILNKRECIRIWTIFYKIVK